MNSGRRSDNVENKVTARETNEWIRTANLSFGSAEGLETTYLCECSAPHCRSMVNVPRAAYELTRADGRQFVIHINHENPELDFVVWQGAGFAVVQMLPGPPSQAACDSDPRLGGNRN